MPQFRWPLNLMDTLAMRTSDMVARESAIAYGRIQQYLRHTPLEPCPWLSTLASSGSVSHPVPESGAGCTALLKLESEQYTGSFKVRGALSKVRQTVEVQ